ncbi:GIY-YIG nuclease family protein [Flaviaesturariibacter amylovorans]|uniref:GIY-YIG domain-containing protein n=1 Tax=Flaviaesturariibacter amylovorans TaxID=1084520 RepID=A0ABP8GP42_9BACT
MPCCTYILFSETLRKYYIGHTCGEVQERLQKHNTNHKGFTGRSPDCRLVWMKPYPDETAADRREREITAWKSSKRIQALIEANNSASF